MSEPISYSVPVALLGRELTPHVAHGSRADVVKLYRAFVERMEPGPVYEGVDHLPADPRFVLAANHYERRGLWIAHAASAIAMGLMRIYECDPPVRWIVTANWPRWRVGPITIPSPGDIVLPRVAHALWCYAVPFAGSNPAATASSLRRLIRESKGFAGPVGIFPEGAGAVANEIQAPLPGVGRFLRLMARRGWPVLPVGVSENGRFVIRFGKLVPAERVASEESPAELVMDHIVEMLRTP